MFKKKIAKQEDKATPVVGKCPDCNSDIREAYSLCGCYVNDEIGDLFYYECPDCGNDVIPKGKILKEYKKYLKENNICEEQLIA